MCGISGIINFNEQPVSGEQILEMTDVMLNRGPDGEGYLLSNSADFCSVLKQKRPKALVVNLEHKQQLVMGHRRLSITDLSYHAAQPMTDSGKRYWIVFNGQIYNHLELRAELETKGYTFKSDHSDTEVILNSYSCWGIDCLQKFNGMWAFCLWDSQENTVFISRDRVGKQPLFYAEQDNTFYFASELNALLSNKNIPRHLDEFAVYDYLTYTNVPAPNTIISAIKKLPAAHYLFFKPGEPVKAKRYWDPISTTAPLELSEKEIIDEIRERLYQSTKQRMSADVKVGMLLSGGVDSSINLACMSKYSTEPVKTFTVGFENKNTYRNEFTYARKIATLFKADYNELIVTEKDFFDFLPHMAYSQDEPIADTANIPIYYLSQLAKAQQVKVLLSGEGSDELFIGYEHWRLIYQFEKVFGKSPLLAGVFEFLHKKSIFKNKRPHYQNWANKVKNHWPVFWSGTELRSENQKRDTLSPDFLSRLGNYNSFGPKKTLYDSLVAAKPYETFEWMTINDIQNRIPDQLLARLDRMLMANSVEGRNPFLDVNLIEFVLRIPSHLKVKNKTEKYLLKKAFEGIIPHEILYRSKDSFAVPINDLFQDSARKKPYMEVIRDFNKDKGIFTEAYLTKLELPSHIKEFWNVLNLALWSKTHI